MKRDIKWPKSRVFLQVDVYRGEWQLKEMLYQTYKSDSLFKVNHALSFSNSLDNLFRSVLQKNSTHSWTP